MRAADEFVMMKTATGGPSRPWPGFLFLALCCTPAAATAGQPEPSVTVSTVWGTTIEVSRSTPTLQVVVNPLLRPGNPVHNGAYAAVKALHASYVRYVPWLPYPKLAVAELEAPTPAGTSWDFSLIDPMTQDFLEAAGNGTPVMNFSTIPEWLFETGKPVAYPSDPNQVFWDYSQGKDLRDPTGKELGDYFARLVSWYVNGGFTDENGRYHSSGHHYEFPIWEVLNEVEFEHNMSPEVYARRYDAIVEAIHRVSPRTRFMALALASPSKAPGFFEYFLDPAHHKPGIPVDYISYHFYATPAAGTGPDAWQYEFFDQADRFLATVGYIEAIRRRLSPATRTDTDEIGSILAGDPGAATDLPPDVQSRYWTASGALYAYLYVELAKQGIEIVGESQLVGYPTQFPTVTMINWETGRPNARYWALKLLVDNFHPGDRLVETTTAGADDVEAQGFETPVGRRLLVINRRNRPLAVDLPSEFENGRLSTVDGATGENPPRDGKLVSRALQLNPFAVSVVSPP
jgi:hypothetical protein